jgi:Reverse transcriptase (RNA-dependent DNA polymerase)
MTPLGLYEPTVMYFGLCNSPGTFMRMMTALFHDMIMKHKVVIYMGDMIFIGKTLEELKANTIEGMEILQCAELYIKESKCYWEVKEVPILGHIIGLGTTRMEPSKVKVIKDWKAPTTKKEIQMFIGFCNFYQ